MAKVSLKIRLLEGRLMELLGKESYKTEKSPCRGKFAGTYDYGLRFDDDTYFFVSNGKRDYEQKLKEAIERLRYFYATKKTLESWVKKVLAVNSEKDNIQYVFDKLYVITDTSYMGYIAFDYHYKKDNEEIHYIYLESSFSRYCRGWINQTWKERIDKNGFSLSVSERKKMATLVKAIFADGNSITGWINGNYLDAKNYYLYKSFNFGDNDFGCGDNMQKCIKVEILDEQLTMPHYNNR